MDSSPAHLAYFIPSRSLSTSVNFVSLTESKSTGRVMTWLSLWSCTWQTGSCSLGKADPQRTLPEGRHELSSQPERRRNSTSWDLSTHPPTVCSACRQAIKIFRTLGRVQVLISAAWTDQEQQG